MGSTAGNLPDLSNVSVQLGMICAAAGVDAAVDADVGVDAGADAGAGDNDDDHHHDKAEHQYFFLGPSIVDIASQGPKVQ
jgi:hypothetical protein